MAFITTDKQKEILDQFQPEQRPEAIKSLISRGHELEGLNARLNPIKALKNIPENAKEMVGGIYGVLKGAAGLATEEGREAAGDVVRGLSSTARGLMMKNFIPEEMMQDTQQARMRAGFITPEQAEQQEQQDISDLQSAETVLNLAKEKFGSWDRAVNTIEENPLDAAMLLSTGLGGVASKMDKLAKLQKGARATSLAKASNILRTASNVTDPTKILKTAGSALGKTGVVGLKGLGLSKKLNQIAANRFSNALGLSKNQAIKFTKSLPGFGGKTPGEFLSQYNIGGSLDDMAQQMRSIWTQSKEAVDTGLKSVPDRFKLRNRQIEGLKNLKEHLDDFTDFETRAKSRIIDSLIKKEAVKGLTLEEMNAAKRIFDRTTDVFDRFGEIKSAKIAKRLGSDRTNLRKFIEVKAQKAGLPDIKKLNRQTQWAKTLEDYLDIAASTPERKGLVNQILTSGGATASLARGEANFLLAAAGVTTGRKILSNPRVQTWLGNKLRLLSEGEFEVLENAIKFNKITPEASKVARSVIKDLKKEFPNISFKTVKKSAERTGEAVRSGIRATARKGRRGLYPASIAERAMEE